MLAGKKSADGAFNTNTTVITKAMSPDLEHGSCYGIAHKKEQNYD